MKVFKNMPITVQASRLVDYCRGHFCKTEGASTILDRIPIQVTDKIVTGTPKTNKPIGWINKRPEPRTNQERALLVTVYDTTASTAVDYPGERGKLNGAGQTQRLRMRLAFWRYRRAPRQLPAERGGERAWLVRG